MCTLYSHFEAKKIMISNIFLEKGKANFLILFEILILFENPSRFFHLRAGGTRKIGKPKYKPQLLPYTKWPILHFRLTADKRYVGVNWWIVLNFVFFLGF